MKKMKKKTYIISIKQNNCTTPDPCAICRRRIESRGVEFFLAGTGSLVCDDCARKYAKPLWDVYHRGEAQGAKMCSEPDRLAREAARTLPRAKSAQREKQAVGAAAPTQSHAPIAPFVPRRKQAYWTITWDLATSTPRSCMLEATSHEEALDEALAIAKRENGCGPQERGGFASVAAYTRGDLFALLSRLSV